MPYLDIEFFTSTHTSTKTNTQTQTHPTQIKIADSKYLYQIFVYLESIFLLKFFCMD